MSTLSSPPATAGPGLLAKHGRWLPLLIAALVLVVYAPTLRNGFVWLDELEIVQGRLIVSDLPGVVSILSDDRNYSGYHRPLYDLMHSLDREIWGLDPRGFHLSSLLLHLANVLLAYAIGNACGFSRAASLGFALLWGLHPVNAAVVGLVHAKADLLVTTLLGGATLSLQKLVARAPPQRLMAGVSIGCLGAALFAKEVAFLFPLAVTLVALCGRDAKALLRRLRGYLIVVWLIALWVAVLRWLLVGEQAYAHTLPLWERAASFGVIYLGYLGELLLPRGPVLADTVTRFGALGAAQQAAALVLLGLVVVVQVLAARRWPRLRVWILLYNLALLPVAQIVPILHFRADRFLYLPSLAAVGLVISALASRPVGVARGRVMGSALLLVLLVYAGGVRASLALFSSDQVLFRYEVARTPDYLEGLCVLGRDYTRRKQYPVAESFYRRCLSATPERISYADRPAALLGLAFVLLAQDRALEARELILSRGSLVREPADREELAYLAAITDTKLEHHAEALPVLQAYARSHPDDASCRYFLGVSALSLGQHEIADRAFRAYLELRPDASDRERVEGYLERLDRH